MEGATDTGEEGRKKDIGHESHDWDKSAEPHFRRWFARRIHTWNVHVRTVDIFPRGQEEAVLVLAHPWPMPPWEQDQV